MKQVQLGRILTVTLMATLSAAFAVGCQASASGQVGGGTPTTPPPPPPPPATTTAAPTPTPAPTTPPPPAGESKLKGDVKGSRVMIPGNISFDSGKATIKIKESQAVLDQLKQFLNDNPQVTLLRVEGHTDSDGDDNMNLKLSGERALAVVTYLTTQGISRDRLLAVGFGETKPVVANDTPANKEQNRRTEFHMAAINGKNYLGREPTAGGTVYKLKTPRRLRALRRERPARMTVPRRALDRAPAVVLSTARRRGLETGAEGLALASPCDHGGARCGGAVCSGWWR